MNHIRVRATRSRDGFTLVEVLLAVAIGAVIMLMVTQTFTTTLQTRDDMDSLIGSNADAQRTLRLLERDLEGLWHYNVRVDDSPIFIGSDRELRAEEADRLDFLTTTDAIQGVYDRNDDLLHPSVCEVGYWLKENPRYSDLLELWRREDPLVDDELQAGGRFQLVTDRLKWFRIVYFETVGFEAEEIDEWNTEERGKLPARMRIEFEIERKTNGGGEIDDIEDVSRVYRRDFTFDDSYGTILDGGVALIPVIPGGPPDVSGAGEQGENGPGGGPGGPAGAGGANAFQNFGRGDGERPFDLRGGERGDARVTQGRATTQTSFGGDGGGRGGPPPGPPQQINLGDLLNGNFGGGSSGGFGGVLPGGGR